MKNLIRQILKEEVEEVGLGQILTKLKKIYPKLDYCLSEDGNRLKIYTYYMSSFEDMGASPDHPEEFTEVGVWIDIRQYSNGGINIGTFNDFRNHDGTYYDTDIDTFENVSGYSSTPTAIFKNITDVLDYELSVEGGITGALQDNYEGRPDGVSAFDWREC